jgi:RHS repeat-associated protein
MQEISCYIVHNHSVNRINVSLKPLHRHRRRNVSLGACVHKKNKHLALTGTQTNATLGESYLYADGSLPSWALLGEYGNGGVSSTGRTEYIWLPTQDGSAIPVGLYRSGKLHAIHTDHLGTPRLIANETNTPQWQWPYSAFGDNAPTGILKPTTSAASAFTSVPATQGSGTTTATLLATSAPTQANNLRFPGQYADSETGLFYNYFRSYQASQGRYTQNDPIGLGGGWNRFGYVEGNPISMTDPLGLMGQGSGGNARGGSRPAAGANASVGGGVSFHLPIGIGLGIDGGIATDTGGNMCFYSVMCYTVGPPGISGSAGGVASVGSGPLTTGVTDYKGVCWSGGAGIAGGGSVLFGNDGSAQVGRGLAGVGGGASVAYQSCKQMLVCRKN